MDEDRYTVIDYLQIIFILFIASVIIFTLSLIYTINKDMVKDSPEIWINEIDIGHRIFDRYKVTITDDKGNKYISYLDDYDKSRIEGYQLPAAFRLDNNWLKKE